MSASGVAQDYKGRALTPTMNLDFDCVYDSSRAENASVREQENEIEAELHAKAEVLDQESYDSYNRRIHSISQDYHAISNQYKIEWQRHCQELATRQRQEARQLEEKWRFARLTELNKQEMEAEERIQSAKLLAACGQWDDAAQLRREAENHKRDEKTPGMKNLDTKYFRFYKQMMRRHECEFQNLYEHLRGLMHILRLKAMSAKSNAGADLRKGQADNSTKICEIAIQSIKTPDVRHRVLQEYSPRKTISANCSPYNAKQKMSRSIATPRPIRAHH
jgi:hypothetical protein